MTIQLPARRLAVAIAALVGLAAVPATASATSSTSQRHDLKLYKVERQVSLTTPDVDVDVACDGSDYALDGMWRVDSVDGAPLSSVAVDEARGDAANPSLYHFTFRKAVAGQAQLKVWVTCLGERTAPDGHQHTFTISPQRTAAFSGGPGVGAGFQPAAHACATGQIAVAPGYAFGSGGGHVVGSRASQPNEADPGRNWAMAFWLDAPSTWTTSFRCLTLRSSTAAGHAHKIVVSSLGFPQAPVTVGAGEAKELQVSCGDQAKGLIGAFDTFPWFAQQDWFLGMDPRIKTRAYKVLNAGADPLLQWVGLTCFNDRTTKGFH